MTAVAVLSMTQPPYARLSTGRLPCIPRRVHTRSPAAPWDRPLAHRAHRPQTNGKACVFIRTMLSGWAYGAI